MVCITEKYKKLQNINIQGENVAMRKIQNKISNRVLAAILSVMMVFSVIPISMVANAATTEYPDFFTVSVKDTEGNPLTDGSVVLSKRNDSWGLYMEEDIDSNGVAHFDSALIENEYQTAIEAGTLVDTALATVYGKVSGYTYGDVHITFNSTVDGTFLQHVELTLEKKITDVTIAGESLTYTGESQELVSVTEVDGDTVTYVVDGGEPTTTVPTATDVCSKEIKVTVSRAGHVDLVKTVIGKIEPGTLSDIDITEKTDLKYNEQEQELVTLTGALLDTDTVTWELNGTPTGSRDIPKADAIGTHTVKLTVERANYKKFEKEVSVDISYGVLNLDSLKIEANNRTYDATTQDAVTVTGQGSYDLEFKLGEEGHILTNTVPQITEAGNYTVYVTAKKTGYNDKDYPTYPIGVTIKQAKIEGVTATGYSAKYDRESHNAVTEVKGTADGDVVTYSKTIDGEYSGEVPSVKRVKDSGTYYVKVYRNDNFETLIIPVTVSITRNDQQVLSFAELPSSGEQELTYNETNTFKYVATTNASDADGDIDYEKVGGTADFMVAADGTVTYTSVGTIEVKATISSCDNYEGTSARYKITISYLETPAWTITPKTTTSDNCNWYKEDVVIKSAGYEIIKGSNVLGQTTWSQEIVETAEADYPDYKVAFRNAAGDVTDLVDIPYFAIDKTAPTEKNAIHVELKDKYTDPFSKIIHTLSFGLFCNEEVEVTVTCDDAALNTGAPNSGIASIELFKYDINGNSSQVAPNDEDVPNVFTLPMGFEGTIKVKVTDKVGNTLGEQLINKGNSNIGDKNASGYIMIEEDTPVLSPLDDEPIEGVRQEEGTHNYSGDVKVKFDAQDTGSGLYSVTVKLNGVDYPVTPTSFATQDRTKHSYELSTVGKTPDENGKYKFEVTVVDNAGNDITDTLIVEKDLTSPIITSFDFAVADGNVAVQDVVSIEDYGYYFKDEVTVTVSAKDEKMDAQDHELVSGVEKITVVLVDKDGQYYTVNEQDEVVEISGTASAQAHSVVNDAYKFKITDDFKGQIYAFATDNVGNTPINSKFNFDTEDDSIVAVDNDGLRGYKRPAGSVLESQEKHDDADYDHITFEKPDTTLHTNDEMNNELYAENVDVKLTVTDKYSGIAQIEWSVVAPYDTKNNQTGTVAIANDEDVDVNDMIGNSGWKVLSKDDNLVTQVEQTITVKNDSNDIVVWVKLTDRAGNTSEKAIEFNIDKQTPIMTVEMNDSDDEKYAGFFKEDRVYKVTILERNFINKNVEFVVTAVDDNNKESTVAVAQDFKIVMDGENPKITVINDIEYYTYEWDSKFSTDGDYKFSVSAVDLAQNKTEDAQVSYVNDKGEDIRSISNTFTVDKTLPMIAVSYDNNTATNEKYFAKARTATVVIKEHNFDVERVNFEALTASLNATPMEDPKITWVSEGNVHTATIIFDKDGDYTFDVKMTDKAANESAPADYGSSVAAKDFVVDQTIVKPTIGGIKDGGAYKEDVIPTISFNDVNYDSYEVKLVRTRRGEKNVDVTAEFIKNINVEAQNISGSFDTFDKTKVENDGIYTLSITVKDKAGNNESEEYTFTVNRFGSVYVYNPKLSGLIENGGQYVQSVTQDLVITEYNADKLLQGSLKILITRDGETVEPIIDPQPTINETVNVGGSGWYEYVYTIKAETFAEDGVYKISLASEYGTDDSEKNESTSVPANSFMENGDPITDTMIFTVDSDDPEIRNIVNLNKAIADVDKIVDGKLNVQYTVVDVGGLKKIEIKVNGKTIQTLTGKDFGDDIYNFTGSFELEEQNGTRAHKVQIIVTDLADNVTDTNSEEFLAAHSKDNEDSTYVFFNEVTVSRNFFVRWYANTGLFWGSIAGVIVLAGGIWFLIAYKRKKKEEQNK